MAQHSPYLLADIGGTHTRIALGGAEGEPVNVRKFVNDEVDDIRLILSDVTRSAGGAAPRYGVIAAAGPVEDDHVRLTNRDWVLSRSELERALGLERLIFVNDFVAMAHALPALALADLVPIGDAASRPDGNLLTCGPGTGFGVAALLQSPGGAFAIATEAGHMRLGATTEEEARVFRSIGEGGSIEVEQILSGRGLAAVHHALTGKEITPREVLSGAGTANPDALRTVAFFARIFGRVVGDLCLAFNAAGAYLGGGIGKALIPFYSGSPFREAFDDHPPYRARMRATPVFAITHDLPGVVGALEIARQEFPADATAFRQAVRPRS